MSVQQTARAAAESHKARDWATSLINRFEEQLPYKAGLKPVHTRLNAEDLKLNLVQISRHRFSEVVLKLVEFLKRTRDGSTDSSGRVVFQQRQYYESAIMLLEAMWRCLDQHEPENIGRHDTTVVKDKLLPEICQILRITTDYPPNMEVRNLAIKVTYSLSSNFFASIYGRISSRLTDLCKDDNQEYTDIELVQYLNLKVDFLIKFLKITIDKVQQIDKTQKDAFLKRSALSVWLSCLEKAINNWMEMYPQELAQIQKIPNDELDVTCSQLFDIIEPWTNQKKGQTVSYLSLLALLLGLSPLSCTQLTESQCRTHPALERKWNFFSRLLCDLGDSSRIYTIAGIKLCKAITYIEPGHHSAFHKQVENKQQLISGQLFGPEARSFFSSKSPSILDLDIMTDCYLICMRLKANVDGIFHTCMSERSPVIYQFVLVSSLYKMVSKPQLSWWPKINSVYLRSYQLRNLFSNIVRKLGYTLFPMKVGSGTKSKGKDRSEEMSIYNNIMVHLVRLIREEPMLVLYNDGNEKCKSTMSLFKSLTAVALTSPAIDVSREAQQALLVLHKIDKIREWYPEDSINMFWDVSYEILMAISRNLAVRRTGRDRDLLKWLRNLFSCRNVFMAKHTNYCSVRLQKEPKRLIEMTTKIEEALFIQLWNIDMESVLMAISCFLMLCEEAEICCSSDEVTTILPNYYFYLELSKTLTLFTTGQKDLQDRILSLLGKIEHCSSCLQQAWEQTFKYWLEAIDKIGEDGQTEMTRSAAKRRTSQQSLENEVEDRINEWAHMTGFLCALGGIYLLKSSLDTQQYQYVKEFISKLLQQLMNTEKSNEQINRHIPEFIEFQMSCSLYPVLFNSIQTYVSKFFDDQNQVQLSDANTQFIEHAIFIMKCILDKSEQQSECQDIINIEITTLLTVRYVRYIETSPGIIIKIKLCQFVEVMIKHRDYLRFRQEIKFRNKLIEYLSEWVMGTKNILMPLADIEVYDAKKLDMACMRTISLLLYNLPLHLEDSDGGDVVQAKTHFYLKYFTLFINLLTDCNEALSEQKEQLTKQHFEAADELNTLRDYTIQAMSNLLSANIDCGLLNSIDFGYARELETRAAFLEVLTKILQQGTEFDMLAETSRAELHKQLVQLVTMISDKGELPIAMSLATVVRADEMDELARVLVNVFESKHLLSSLLWNIFHREVSSCENVQTLFRGNSLGTKIMSLCCQLFGAEYLQKLLNPLIAPMLEDKLTSYEVDPAKLESGSDIERNRSNLIKLTNEVFDKIVSSVDSFPPNLRMMCHCLYQVLCKNYPSAPQNTGTVGTILFLRFINPAIVSPQKFGIVKVNELPHNVQRGLMFMSKILQNIANRIDFNKEQHMVYFNNMLRKHQDKAHYFFIQISKDVETNTQADESETYVTEPNHAALHRLLYTHQEGINNYLSSSRNYGKDVGRRPFDKLAILLAHLGEPQPKSADLDLLFPNNMAWIKSDKFFKNIEEAVKKLDPREMEQYKSLKQINIFYESGISKKKYPVFYYIARRYKAADMNINLLYLHVMITLQSCWDLPFELVVDLTHVSPQNRFRFEYMEKWLKIDVGLKRNLVGVYFYNCNSFARDFIKFHGLGKNLGDKVHFVNDTKKFEEFIEKDQQRLPGATVTLNNDLTIFTNALKLANRDTKVTIKVGPSTVQVTEKTKILGQLVYVNDVYYVSEIDRVMVVDDNQFTLTKSDESLNFIHNECESIIQAVMHIRNRWELSQPEAVRVHPKIRPKDVPGTLLNMALLNLGSSNPNVRSAAYNLLCALTATFNLKINQQLHITSGLCIPSNNTVFIKRVSEILAAKDSHLTLQFLEECIQGFRVSCTELKHLCLEYMTPWLNNLARLYKPSEESGGRQKQVNLILEKLITLTIEEVDILPSIETKIWSTIGKLTELIDPVLKNLIQRSLRYGINSPMVEVMANTTVALASSNVEHVSDRAIKLLEKVIKSTATTPTTQLEQNAKWPEIAIHVRHLVMLSFNNCLNVGKHLPKLFHIVTLLVCSGSLTMRASVYGLVINVIHSLCTCSLPSFSEETYKVLKMSLDGFSLPKFLKLFGISNVKSATVNAFRSNHHNVQESWFDSERIEISQDYDKFLLTNLEIVTDTMLEVTEACIRDMRSLRWLDEWTDLAKNFAFSHNRALKPRALIVFGCISKIAKDEDVRLLLNEFVNALDRFDIMLLEAIVICFTRLEPILDKKSSMHRYLFWVALSMLQMENASLYSSGLALLEQNLQILDSFDQFHKDLSLEQVIMEIREPLENQFNWLDTKLGLSFRSNFHFALVGYLLKGYWHPNPTTVTRNARVLNMLLHIVAKSSNKRDQFQVTPQNVAYLAALIPVSDEVRKKCPLRHLHSVSIEEFGSIGSSNNHGPPLNRIGSENNVLLNPEVLKDSLTQTLILAVLATLVKHSTSEDQARILYEYLAESSFVFENVFPVIYNFLDQKISNIVSLSHDQRTLNAVLTIILNGIACEDTSNTQLYSLQHYNLSGLWRFSGSYTNSNSSPENAQHFLDLFKAMKHLIWKNHSSKTTCISDSTRMQQSDASEASNFNVTSDQKDLLLEEQLGKPDNVASLDNGN